MGDAGLFGPGSLTWRINREGVLLLGGGRALILQVAHPLVAAGVAAYSNYREDPWGRLYRTLDITTRIVFGDTETAREASGRLERMHSRVRGETTEPGGDRKSTRLNSSHANTPYAVFCLKKQSTTSSSSSTSSSSPSKQSDSIASSLGLTSTRADRPAS